MIVKINKKIGNTTLQFEVEGGDSVEALYNTSSFTTMPESCGLCHSSNLVLDGMKAKTKEGKVVTYVKIKCLDCGASSTAGVRMDDRGLFWKPFEKYEPKD